MASECIHPFTRRASVSGVAMKFTSKYQKKLTKVTKLADIVTSAIAIFEMSISKVLNNGEIVKQEFDMLQVLHLKVINELANVDCKMELETRKINCRKVCYKRLTR